MRENDTAENFSYPDTSTEIQIKFLYDYLSSHGLKMDFDSFTKSLIAVNLLQVLDAEVESDWRLSNGVEDELEDRLVLIPEDVETLELTAPQEAFFNLLLIAVRKQVAEEAFLDDEIERRR